MRRLLPLCLLLGAAGCVPTVKTGGSPTEALNQALATGTAPYAVLDLTSGAVTYRLDLPDAQGNAAYRDNLMVFRRVGSGSSQVLVAIFELTQAQWVRLDPIHSTPWAQVPTEVVPASASATSGTYPTLTLPAGGVYPAFNLPADDLATALAAFAPSSGVRLAIPSAAQWATAAGASSGYSWGPVADRAHLVEQAVLRETVLTNARLAPTTTQIDAGGPAVVASRSPSASGLYDLHGNVWEWVAGGTAVRGGSWYDPASLARIDAGAGAPQGLLPDIDHALIGARLVLIP